MAALWRAISSYVWSSPSQSSSSSSDRQQSSTTKSSSCREESPSLIELVDSEMFSFPQFAPHAPKPYGTDEFVRAHMLSEGGHQRAALRAWDDIEQVKKESLKRARARARARRPQAPPSKAISSLRALIAKKASITPSPPTLLYPVLTLAAQGSSGCPQSPTSPGPCQGSSFAASSSSQRASNKPTSKSRQRHNLAAAFGPMAPGLIRSFEESPPSSVRIITPQPPRVRVSSPLSSAAAAPDSAGQERDESSPFHNPWSRRHNTNNIKPPGGRLSAKHRFAQDFPNGANIAASPSSLLSTSVNNNTTNNGENFGLISAFTAITQSMRNQLNLPWVDIPEVTDLVHHYYHHHHSDSDSGTSKSFTPQTLAAALSACYRYRYHNDAQGRSLPRDNIALGIVVSEEDHHRMGDDDDSYRGVLVYVDTDSDADGGEGSLPVMTTIWIYHEAEAGNKGEAAAGGEFTSQSVFHPLRAAEEELGVMARIRSLS